LVDKANPWPLYAYTKSEAAEQQLQHEATKPPDDADTEAGSCKQHPHDMDTTEPAPAADDVDDDDDKINDEADADDCDREVDDEHKDDSDNDSLSDLYPGCHSCTKRLSTFVFEFDFLP